MGQYEVDAVRFLTGRAKAARLMKNYADEENFTQCADRVKELEAEVERLKKIIEAPWKCDICGNYLWNNSASELQQICFAVFRWLTFIPFNHTSSNSPTSLARVR